MKRILLLACCLLVSKLLLAQRYTIAGYMKDAESGESLIGANIFNLQSKDGTSANQFGFYSFTQAAGEIQMVVSYVGYQSETLKFDLQQDTTINFNLLPNTLDEIVISGNSMEEIQQQTQMSRVNVSIQEIKKLPALLGEVDVLKTLQLLPGVQSGNEGTSGVYVRGGGPDQNLILLDGVPVYNASHLFGFFSIFNADAINNVEIIKGGFPARYGGRLSSVIDISMKDGNHNEFHGEGSIGLVSSKLTLEGPINKGKTSFIVSGRRTYIDLLARPIIKAASEGDDVVGYFFYDFNAKLNHRFSDKDQVYLSLYTGDDKAYNRFRYSYSDGQGSSESLEKSGLQWGNVISAFRWNRVWNNKLFSNTTLTFSRYRFKVFQEYEDKTTRNGETENDYYYNAYNSGIRDFAGRIDFEYLPNPSHQIRFGLSTINHLFTPGVLSYQDQDVDTLVGSSRVNANEMALYFEDEISVSKRLNLNLGLHLSAFAVEGELYTSLQPRFSARYLLTPTLSVKASYAEMAQFVHLLTNSGIGLPTDLWVPSTSLIEPQQSQQVALGIAKNLNNKFELSVEGYYKKMQNLIEYQEGASFLNVDKDWQTKIEVGDGESYGIEMLLQKKMGRTTGWLGYTLSWTWRQFDNLNFGERFPYRYDRRHDLSLAITHELSKKVDFSAAWVYGTGNAVTLPVSTYPRPGNNYGFGFEIRDYESRNAFRMPSYHRLDINFTFKKKKKKWERAWHIGVYNLYSRQNPFYLDLVNYYGEDPKFVQYSLFPIIPSVKYSFKF